MLSLLDSGACCDCPQPQSDIPGDGKKHEIVSTILYLEAIVLYSGSATASYPSMG